MLILIPLLSPPNSNLSLQSAHWVYHSLSSTWKKNKEILFETKSVMITFIKNLHDNLTGKIKYYTIVFFSD